MRLQYGWNRTNISSYIRYFLFKGLFQYQKATEPQYEHQQLPKYVIGNYCMRRLFTTCVMTVLGVNIDIKHIIDYLVNSKQQINFRQEFLDHQNRGKVLLQSTIQ